MNNEFLSGFRETAIDKLIDLKKKIEAHTQELGGLRKEHDVILSVILTLNQGIAPDLAAEGSTVEEEITTEECPVVEAPVVEAPISDDIVWDSTEEDSTPAVSAGEEPALYHLPPRERDLLNLIRRKKYLTRDAAVKWYVRQSPSIQPQSAASNVRRCITALSDRGLITRTVHGTWRPRKAGE